MSPAFEDALHDVLQIEGEYSDHPSDPGGSTRWGISEPVAREHGYEGEMRDLPIWIAKEIYWTEYWQPLELEAIHDAAPSVAVELFDTAVNMGTRQAVRFLQRSLNALNRRGRDYSDIAVDGLMGPQTLVALCGYVQARPPRVLVAALNSLQGARYIGLVEQNESLEDFTYGWFRRRVHIGCR